MYKPRVYKRQNKNRTQTAAINIFNLIIFINLTFRMLLNRHPQKQRIKSTAKTVDEDPASCKRWISRKEI